MAVHAEVFREMNSRSKGVEARQRDPHKEIALWGRPACRVQMNSINNYNYYKYSIFKIHFLPGTLGGAL